MEKDQTSAGGKGIAFRTAAREGHGEFEEKKSLFIGSAARVCDENAARAFIDRIKKEHRDARHNVYAYLLSDGTMRCSDDGEPQGTGGVPTLEILKKSGCTDVCVVVTRYFGGILLGTGGLSRAYSEGAKLALADAGTAEFRLFLEYQTECSYADYQKLSALFSLRAVRIDSCEYGAAVSVRFAVETGRADELKTELAELFAGRLTMVKTGERYDAADAV